MYAKTLIFAILVPSVQPAETKEIHMSLRLSRSAGAAVLVAAAVTLAGCSLIAPPVATPAPTVTVTVAPIEPDKPAEEPVEDEASTGFTTIVDSSGVVSVSVPETWTDVADTPVTDNTGLELLNVAASPDLDAYSNGWDTPGVSVSATDDPAADPDSYLDNITTSFGGECDPYETGDYDDSVYVGTYLYFPNCGGTTTDFLAVVASDADGTHLVVFTVQMVTEEDKTTTRDELLNTFYAVY
jgi:serine protease Do